jgi:hypothetical protein
MSTGIKRARVKLRHAGAGYHITKKGYPRFNCEGKFKGAYVHRYEAAKMLGRELRKDEEVHHRNRNKLDWTWANLEVMGSEQHGWVSALQAFWMKHQDVKSQKEWDAYFDAAEREREKLGVPKHVVDDIRGTR